MGVYLWGTGYDHAYSVQQTVDGGYIVAGSTLSFGAGGGDSWIMKLDENGVVTWQKAYGTPGTDYPYSVRQTQDGDILWWAIPPSVQATVTPGS